jgi:hypothetical protein
MTPCFAESSVNHPDCFGRSKEQHMPSSKRVGIIGAHRSDVWLLESDQKPALSARIWAGLLTALHESRKQEAARMIRRHREFIENFQAIELPGDKNRRKANA